ncbi:MAG: preprotein translocase subunit YajC [Sarcina sp.]
MNFEGMLITFGPIVIMFLVFWVLMIRPEKKRQKNYTSMLDELRVHDKIITKGGIVGKVIKINGEEIIVDSEGTRLRMAKNAVNTKIASNAELNTEK